MINDDPQESENNANYMKLEGSATVHPLVLICMHLKFRAINQIFVVRNNFSLEQQNQTKQSKVKVDN